MDKLYFQKDDEKCYGLQWHYDYMRENDLKELIVFKAVVDHNNGHFYCKFSEEIVEKNETCNGRYCDEYNPKNGIKGRCKWYGYCYEPIGKEIKLTLKNKLC